MSSKKKSQDTTSELLLRRQAAQDNALLERLMRARPELAAPLRGTQGRALTCALYDEIDRQAPAELEALVLRWLGRTQDVAPEQRERAQKLADGAISSCRKAQSPEASQPEKKRALTRARLEVHYLADCLLGKEPSIPQIARLLADVCGLLPGDAEGGYR